MQTSPLLYVIYLNTSSIAVNCRQFYVFNESLTKMFKNTILFLFSLCSFTSLKANDLLIDDLKIQKTFSDFFQNTQLKDHTINKDIKKYPLDVPQNKASIAVKKDAGSIYKELLKSTVIIAKKDKNQQALPLATGIILSSEGIMLTNAHVVISPANRKIVVMDYKMNIHTVDNVFWYDIDNDLALVKLNGNNFESAKLSSSTSTGSKIYHLGHPANNFYTFTYGTITRNFVAKKKAKVMERITISADYAKGSSGAPIINEYGEVCAIASSTSSIYHSRDTYGKGNNLQMVLKTSIPIRILFNALKRP
jgi:serine protease Do